MKRDRIKGFFSGIVVSAITFSLGASAFAAYQKQATLDYTGIKITLNGSAVTPKDANGNSIEPFAISGTTYLPVRGIASAMGLNVTWDQATQTVALTSGGQTSSEAAGMTSGTVVMDKGGIKIIYLGIEQKQDGLKGYDIKVQIVNSTDTNYTVQVRDLSLNGIMCPNVIFSTDVASQKTANSGIWVYNLEGNGISTPIKTAEFYFHIFESDSYSGGFDSDVITIK